MVWYLSFLLNPARSLAALRWPLLIEGASDFDVDRTLYIKSIAGYTPPIFRAGSERVSDWLRISSSRSIIINNNTNNIIHSNHPLNILSRNGTD